MRRAPSLGVTALAGALAITALVTGCAAHPAPELERARSAYDRAVTGPAFEKAPDELAAAAAALRTAERAAVHDPRGRRTRELAYLAQRYAELAIARARIEAARHELDVNDLDRGLARRRGDGARAGDARAPRAQGSDVKKRSTSARE